MHVMLTNKQTKTNKQEYILIQDVLLIHDNSIIIIMMMMMKINK